MSTKKFVQLFKQNFYQLGVVLVFAAIISIPTTASFLGLDHGVNLQENRSLVQQPTLYLKNIWAFPQQFLSFFNDNFGFRSTLIAANHYIKIKLLNTSPNEQVTLGKNDWLFLTPEANFAETLNGQPFSQNELQQVKKNLEEMDKYFTQHGSHFYFMIAPSAQSIYPEFLPNNFKKINPNSKLDQLTKYLQDQNSKVAFINPKPALFGAKSEAQLYYKYDIHWNQYGGFIAYTELMNRLARDFPRLKPEKMTDFSVNWRLSQRQDLEGLIGVANYYHEDEPIFERTKLVVTKYSSKDCPGVYDRCQEITEQASDASLPKMIAFRDSFGSWLIPFMAPHFSKSIYIWEVTPFSTDIVLKEKPDIVLFELTERSMWMLISDIFRYE